MFFKLLVSLFSILVLFKNFSYSMYEYNTNKNIVGSVSVASFSFVTVVFLNVVLFFIKF